MKQGILLINLGSPDSPEEADVKRYLKQFLMDPMVIDLLFLFRYFLVNYSIIPKRLSNTSEAYASIWEASGSPLKRHSEQLFKSFSELMDYPVALGMRYGSPSIESAVDDLRSQAPDLERILVCALYPHYAMSSSQTAEVMAERMIRRLMPGVEVDFLPPFFAHPQYIQALSTVMKQTLSSGYEYVLFSYHGLPERHVRKTDVNGDWCLKRVNCCERESSSHERCYRHQVYKTTELVVKALQIPFADFTVSFQSRLGNDPWLSPNTEDVIVKLAKRGVKKLHVVCPAFVADCLETLEEIKDRGRELFLANGGKELVYVPCMNSDPAWVSALKEIVTDRLDALNTANE